MKCYLFVYLFIYLFIGHVLTVLSRVKGLVMYEWFGYGFG